MPCWELAEKLFTTTAPQLPPNDVLVGGCSGNLETKATELLYLYQKCESNQELFGSGDAVVVNRCCIKADLPEQSELGQLGTSTRSIRKNE